MSGVELVERLTAMLRTALGIIQVQSELLEQHGIRTFDGALERMADMICRESEATVRDGQG